MHVLAAELSDNQELASAVEEVEGAIIENDAHQGLVLDLNPFWRAAERLDSAGLNPEVLRWEPPFLGPYDPFWNLPINIVDQGRRPDFSKRYRYLDNWFEHVFGRPTQKPFQPYLLRIVASPEPTDPTRRERYASQREQLVSAAQEARVPTIVETHPLPELSSKPGSKVTHGNLSGTLGGYLKDSNLGTIYGVTCGHAVPAAYAASHGGTILHIEPSPNPNGNPCTKTCSHITEIDLALLDAPYPSPNTATQIALFVSNGDMLEMKGAVSGTRQYQVGGHVVYHKIGQSCWRELIQLCAPTNGSLIPIVRTLMCRFPKKGDSGSWLLNGSSEWTGMVVAASGSFGFALPPDRIIQRAKANFALDLELA